MASTQLVGILNVTPDSFSDGGRHFSPQQAASAITRMVAEGADIIDIGAESTRPGAAPLTPAQEWQRLEPVLALLGNYKGMRFSLDTRHAETARRSLASGIGWINDVSGFASPAMLDVAAEAECGLVAMHSLSVPADKNIVMAEDADVVEEIIAFGRERIAALRGRGVAAGRIVFDPGIGFGKTAAQSHAILRGIERFRCLGVKLMVGHSRKSFLGAAEAGAGRDAATLAVSGALMRQGVEYLRVHDVAAHARLRQEVLGHAA